MKLSLNKFSFVAFLLVWVRSVVTQKQPHIILIMIDDLGWNDISLNGMNEILTPNIDTLANAGVILNNYYAQPLCTPTRGCLMTGVHPVRTGLQHLVFYDSKPQALPLEYVLLPQRLKKLGYVTSMIGKWHLGFYHRNFTPTFRGFDSHYGYWTGSTDYFQKTGSELLSNDEVINLPPGVNKTGKMPFAGLDWRDNMKPMTVNSKQYVTHLFTEKAVETINRHDKSKPLFMYLAHLAVHRGNSFFPIRTPERYLRGFEDIADNTRKHFAGKVKALDLSIGALMEALLANRMLQDTIIIFTSDNGASTHGDWSTGGSNYPLRGQKNTHFEGGIKVPAFIWSPRLKNTPRISNQMMHVLDWMPTLYSAAGGNVYDLGDMDGMNLWPTITDDVESPRNGFLINIDPLTNEQAIRKGDWKLVKTRPGSPTITWYGPRGLTQKRRRGKRHTYSKVLDVLRRFHKNRALRFPRRLKPLDCGNRPRNDQITNCSVTPCLFNIPRDPCEYYDLSSQHPEIVDELEMMIQQTRTVPPIEVHADYRSAPMFHSGVWDTWMDDNTVQCSSARQF